MIGQEIVDLCIEYPNAFIYIEADHGQMPEQAGGIFFSDIPSCEQEYYGSDIEWVFDPADLSGEVTAILIR